MYGILIIKCQATHLPPDARWREWMHRVEATIFAASEPVTRETLARIVGRSCSIDLLIDDIREELRGRPYDLVAVAGGWKHLTRPAYADAIRAAVGGNGRTVDLTQSEVLVLMGIAYFQPITRGELSSFFGKEISRDFIGHLRGAGMIASGPRSPTPGAPYTYVTTKKFLLGWRAEKSTVRKRHRSISLRTKVPFKMTSKPRAVYSYRPPEWLVG